MSVRVSRRLLEAALAGLNEAVDPNLDSADSYDKLVTALDSARDGAEWSTKNIEGMGDGFIKQNGDWYVKTELTSELLAQILTAAGEEKLAKADKKNSLDLSLDATDFVGGVGKGVNFVREEPGGVWRDNTPINSKMLAAYKFKEQMGAVMPVTREGALRAVKDDNFMFVLDQNAGEFYIMDVANDVSDPLGSMKRLFDNANLNSAFGVDDQDITEARRLSDYLAKNVNDEPPARGTPARKTYKPTQRNKQYVETKEKLDDILSNFVTIVPFVNDPKGFNFSTEFFKGGKIEDAIKSARTIFGAFFDLLIKGANLKMEFVFTPYGPAFKRQQQFLRGLFSETALSNADFQKFAGTDYFEVVNLPKAEGKYTFKVPASPPASTSGAVVISSDSVPDVKEKTADLLGNKGKEVASDSYGWAYVLYLLGLLTRGDAEAPAVAPVTPAPEPAAPPEDPLGDFLKGKGSGPVGDPNGAVFFNFNSSNVGDVSTNSTYIDSIATAIKEMVTAAGGSIPDDTKIQFTLVGCADPAGTNQFNQGLAKNRNKAVMDAISTKTNDITGINPKTLEVTPITPGENPWPGDWSTITNEKPGAVKLRFAKLYWSKLTPEVAGDKALEFATEGLTAAGAIRESLQIEIAQIREHIRKIARSL